MIRKFNVQGHDVEIDDSLEYLSVNTKTGQVGRIDLYGFFRKLDSLGKSSVAGILAGAVKVYEDYKADRKGISEKQSKGLDNTSKVFRDAYMSIFGREMP